MQKLNQQDIILTGATGFVGKVLIKKLIKKYNRNKILCLVFNRDTPSENSGRKLLNKLNIKFKLVDLTKKHTLSGIPKNPKLIIHLAAETDTSTRNHSVNDMGTKNLYKALGKLPRQTHFIHIGTMIETVGRPNCDKPIDENSMDYPTNEYTRTKLNGEKFITNRCINDKFKLTVIRPNTIYGKNVRKDSLFDLVTKMVQGNSIITRINWPGRSALIHVEDLTDIILRFTDNSLKPGNPEKYLAYGENLTILDISKTVHNKLGIKFRAINLHTSVWSMVQQIRKFIPFFENLLPYKLYNSLWRFGIIIDDVVWCNSNKLFEKFKFKPIKFTKGVEDVT